MTRQEIIVKLLFIETSILLTSGPLSSVVTSLPTYQEVPGINPVSIMGFSSVENYSTWFFDHVQSCVFFGGDP